MDTTVLKREASGCDNDFSNCCITCLKKTGTSASTENGHKNVFFFCFLYFLKKIFNLKILNLKSA